MSDKYTGPHGRFPLVLAWLLAAASALLLAVSLRGHGTGPFGTGALGEPAWAWLLFIAVIGVSFAIITRDRPVGPLARAARSRAGPDARSSPAAAGERRGNTDSEAGERHITTVALAAYEEGGD